jgi:putative ABC transport system substrate-binding protein
MNRRQLVSALSAMSIIGPRAVLAQPSPGRRQRIGVMMAISENDPEGLHRVETFRHSLKETGWTEGRNVLIEIAWYRGNFQRAQIAAKDFADRKVDVIVVNGTPGMDALRVLGTTIPIVFVVVSDPVGAGFVSNLSRPGANVTGFSAFEPTIAGKWLQLLTQVAPGLKHVNMLLDPKFTAFKSLWKVIEDVAPRQGISAHPAYASSLPEIERALEVISKQTAAGLIVTPSPVNTVNRKRLISIANESGIPAIFPFRFYVRDGALMAYGFNAADQFGRAAAYVDRILQGERAGDLPVQEPRLFEFGINLRSAGTMGLTVPQSLLIMADEIIK